MKLTKQRKRLNLVILLRFLTATKDLLVKDLSIRNRKLQSVYLREKKAKLLMIGFSTNGLEQPGNIVRSLDILKTVDLFLEKQMVYPPLSLTNLEIIL